MEMALQQQRLLCCSEPPMERRQFAIRPAVGLFIQTAVQCREFRRRRAMPCIIASSGPSEYSRRRPRRNLAPRTKGSTPKGFTPRPTSTQKKDQSSIKETIVETGTADSGSELNILTSEVPRRIDVLEEVEERSYEEDGVDKKAFLKIPSVAIYNDESSERGSLVGGEGDRVSLSAQSLSTSDSFDEIGEGKVTGLTSEGGGVSLSAQSRSTSDSVDEIGEGKVTGLTSEGDGVSLSAQSRSTSDSFDEIEEGKVTGLTSEGDGVSLSAQSLSTSDSFDEIGEGKVTGLTSEGDGVSLSAQSLSAGDSFDEFGEGKVTGLRSEGDVVSLSAQSLSTSDSFDEIGEGKVTGLTGEGDGVNLSAQSLSTSDSFDEIGEGKVKGLTGEIDGVSLSAQSLSTSDSFDEIGEGKVTGLTSEIDEQNADSEHHVTIAGRTSSLSYNEEVEIEVMAENDRDVAQDEELHEVDEYPMDVEADARDSTLSRKADIEAQARKQILEDIAEENFERGDKVFTIPNSIKCDQIIEVYLNRSLSALSNESDVLLKGAFNGWRWNFFTEKLHKSDLKGDWWSCQLYVPKEAYRIDFVFFNGGNIYENNNSKDYFLPVESRMDEAAFEDFLFEEKQRELERIAAEEAERERQAEEQRRKEEEKAAIEADRAQAKIDVEKKRQTLQRQMQLARTSLENVWHIVPNVFKGGETVRLFYNRSSRPLAHATEIWIHGGHNSWSDGLSIVERLLPSEKRDGDWWYADVVVPDEALVLDWVFADGPPQSAKIYDNNSLQDFHATVPKCMSEELFWVEEEERIFRKLQQERRLKQEAVRKKVEKTAQLKAQTKENTLKKFLLSQKHIVYTEPLEIRAGNTVAVLYNPSNTILSGKPEVWFRCSFNRWTHRNGPLPPQKMVNAENGSHLKATVKIPADAYMMDFVFSEREDGGIYDNRNGMDYHIPVSEGILKEPPMHIVHIAVEMAPIAKVGGLGDVVTSLSRAVQDLGHNVDIIFPKYDCMNLSNVKDFHFRQSFSWGGTEIKVWFGTVEGLSVYFLEPQNGMFWVGCIYGRNDGDRFAFFCRAALEFLLQSGSRPDILHCHDWSSAPVAWMFKEHYRHGLSNARVIFTIHNLEFGIHHISRAMTYADKATTVSHRYSKEVSGNPAISPHLYKFHGILNGIDPDIWDPYNDNFIPVSYTAENVVEGKKAAKEALQQRLGLRKSDYPLVGIITRLTVQKGIHLIKHAIWRTLERNGQVVLLGTAPDHRIQNEFVNLANQLHSSHADRARLCLTYDEPLSHLIYAGADFILVPSIFEPCGLTQLIAMRYGSIPIVRKTGGLYDTVFDIDNDKERAQAQGLEPNGFNFDGADTSSVDYALNRAISAWFDAREWFNSVCKRVMEQDWSWNRPALDYMELYHSARKY